MGKNIYFAAVPAGEQAEADFRFLLADEPPDFEKVKAAVQLVPVCINGQQLAEDLYLTTYLAQAMDDASSGTFYRMLHPNPNNREAMVVSLAAYKAQLYLFAVAAKAFVPINETVDDFRPESDSTVKQCLVDFASAAQELLNGYGSRAVLLVI